MLLVFCSNRNEFSGEGAFSVTAGGRYFEKTEGRSGGHFPRGVDEIPCGWQAVVGSESLPGEELPPC